MAATQRKPTARARAKPKTARPRARKKTQNKNQKSLFILWLVLTLLVIIALLSMIIYLLLDRPSPNPSLSPSTQDYQRPSETITLPKEVTSPQPQQPEQDSYQASYTLQREVTAHVADYWVIIRKNDIVFSTIKHSSAPIESVTIDSQSDPIRVKVVAVDHTGGEIYRSTYVYQLTATGQYRLLE